jgi:hydroxymethylpyrimidine pyrophosphatase-like HAD family hydrolase
VWLFSVLRSRVRNPWLLSFCQYYNGELGDVFAVPQNDEHRALLARYAALVGRDQILIDDYQVAISKSLPAKVLILSNDAQTLYAKGKARYTEEQLNIFIGSPHPYFVEFLNPSASKGAGLAQVCEHLGIRMSEVVAFGDGDNDKEMLQLAGMGVAMRNATPGAKEAANVVLEVKHLEPALQRSTLPGVFAS